MNLIESVESEQVKKPEETPDFSPGDLVRVRMKVVEGDKERTQLFEGIVIRRRHRGLGETFTVRRLSYGVGIERTFPLHSPYIESIDVLRKGSVRRAKLYYLRQRTGKAARVKESRTK